MTDPHVAHCVRSALLSVLAQRARGQGSMVMALAGPRHPNLEQIMALPVPMQGGMPILGDAWLHERGRPGLLRQFLGGGLL